MRTILALCASAALCIFVAPSSLAQGSSQTNGQTSFGYGHGFGETQHYNACSEDYAKFCGDVSRYGMRQCLLDHQFDYSAPCKEERKREAAAAQNAHNGGSSYDSESASRSHLSGQ